MTEQAYYGYTGDELRKIAGTAVAPTVAPLVASPVDGWRLHRFALALGCGALATLVALALHR